MPAVERGFVGGADPEGEARDDGTVVVADVGGDAVDHDSFECRPAHGLSLETGAHAPVRFERGAGEHLVVVVPLVGRDVVDPAARPARSTSCGCGAERAAGDRAEIDDRDGSVRVFARVGLAEEHADEPSTRASSPASSASSRTTVCSGDSFGSTHPAIESPLAVVGAVHEQDAVVVVEHRGVGTDLRGHVSDLGVEALPDRRGRERRTRPRIRVRDASSSARSARGRTGSRCSADRSARWPAPRRAARRRRSAVVAHSSRAGRSSRRRPARAPRPCPPAGSGRRPRSSCAAGPRSPGRRAGTRGRRRG